MPRSKIADEETLEATLQFQVTRGLTPEEAAAELGVSMDTLRRYLALYGGAIVTYRRTAMPERDSNDTNRTETRADGR